MSKELVGQNNSAMTVSDRRPQETVLKSDALIPKLLLMQGLSDLVGEGKAKIGDMVRSTTGDKIGDETTPLEIIPLTFTNSWIVTEKVGGKYEFRAVEPRTATNEAFPWEFTKDGTQWKRTKAIDLFALLPSDIAAEQAEIKKAQETGEMPDMNKCLLPVVVRFQSTGFKAGRQVATHFAMASSPSMAKFGVKPYGFSLKLSAHREKNDKGSFSVFDVSRGAKVSKEQYAIAEEWYARVAYGDVQVDESDVSKETAETIPF